MRPRLALISVIVLGVLTTGTGVSLALSGPSSQGSASEKIYAPPNTPNGSKNPTAPIILGTQGNSPSSGNAPATVNGTQTLPPTATPSGSLQPVRQVAATTSNQTLPFTGFAAIPVLLLGLGLLSAGAVLGRRARRDES